MFVDNADSEAEASHKSAKKESRTVEQTERQVTQAGQQAIFQDIHATIDRIYKSVTSKEETQQRNWQTQVQQQEQIKKIETQML